MITKLNNFVNGFVSGIMGTNAKKVVKKVPAVKCAHKKKCKCN